MKKNNFKRDFISFSDFSQKEIWDLLILAKKFRRQTNSQPLRGKSVGLIFQKPSTRTAVSFAVGVHQLGGQPLILSADILQIKRGESPRDTGRVLSRYLHAIVVRAHKHGDLLEMAGYARIPVINGLTDVEHPCQVLADLLTIMDHQKLKHPKQLAGLLVSYVGDGNNVAHSWILAAALMGMKFHMATPKGYEPKEIFLAKARELNPKSHIKVMQNPEEAVQGAKILYTDVWASMGQEAEGDQRRIDFAPYQLNSKLVALADKGAMVMHCLPAHRGEEITEEVLEGPQSVVFDQAENRLHVQKAVLATLLKKRKK